MKIENLQQEMTIKNYKELCGILNVKVKTGESKQCQLRDFERYFKYHKDGNKFIIDEIYEVPKEKIDNRGKSKGSRNNNNIYGKYIEKLVLDLLVQQYNSTDLQRRKIYMSRDKMLLSLNMVNDNYTFSKFNKKVLCNYINVDIDNAKEFYDINNKNLLDTAERAFDSLANKCLIDWNLVTTVAVNEESYIINEDGKEIKLSEIHRTATEYEREWILDAEQRTLVNMGMESKKEVYLKDQYEEFNKCVCEILQEEETDIKYYYKSYDIVFHPNIIKELEKINKFILEQEERQNIKVTLNGIISKRFKENVQNRQDKASEEKEKVFGIDNNAYAEMKRDRRLDYNYIDDNNKIIDTVIDYKTKDLTFEMQEKYKKDIKKSREEIDKVINSIF